MVWDHFSIIVTKYSSGLWKLYFKGHNPNSHFISFVYSLFLKFSPIYTFVYFKFLVRHYIIFTTLTHSKFFFLIPLFVRLRRCFWERKIDRWTKVERQSRKCCVLKFYIPCFYFGTLVLLFDAVIPRLRASV